MKSQTFLKSILTVIIASGLMFSSASDQTHDPDRFNLEVPVLDNSSSLRVVRAIIVDGVVYPAIELPTVEITGSISGDNLVRGQVINGEVVPSILLDEVVITPNS